jgi:hypothetical protein
MSAESLFEEEKPATQDPLDGVTQAKHHLMQASNLYVLCIRCVDKVIAPNCPEIAQTSEMFQAAVTTLFDEATRWAFVEKMPGVPLKK